MEDLWLRDETGRRWFKAERVGKDVSQPVCLRYSQQNIWMTYGLLLLEQNCV